MNMAATLPNTVLFYMKTTKTSTLKRGALLRLNFERGLTRYSFQTLPVHSVKILWPPEVHSQTKHIGRRPKRWGIRARNRFLKHCRVLSLNLFPWAHFAVTGWLSGLGINKITIPYHTIPYHTYYGRGKAYCCVKQRYYCILNCVVNLLS